MSNYQPTPHTTATQPPPVVLADAGTHPSPRFSRADPPTVKTWAGIHPRTPTSMSFRAQRSGAGESCCRINPSPIGATLMIARPNGFTQPFPSLHTSFPHPPVIPAPPSVVPAKAGTHPSFNPPVPVGAVREPPVPFPSLVLADAGTHPSPRFSRAHPPAVKTWAGIHPRTPTSMSFRAQRSGAGESCCRINPSPIGATLMIARPNGFTQPFPPLHTSSPHPPVIPAPPSVVPAKAGTHPSFNPPVPVGAVREPPVPFPSLVLADAGTPPSLRFSREAPALVKTGPESIPSPVGATLVVALIRLIPPSPVGAGFKPALAG